MLLARYEEEQMMADQRAYQLYSAILMPHLSKGASLPAPGDIFPSLQSLESSEGDEVDPAQSWREVGAMLGVDRGKLD